MSAAVDPSRQGEVSGPAGPDAQRLLTALVKAALVGEAGDLAQWRADAVAAQAAAAGELRALTAHDLDGLWSRAVAAAERDPAVRRDETVNPTLPTISPLRPEVLGAEPFDLDAAIRTIRDEASFG